MTDAERRRLVTLLTWQIYRESAVTNQGAGTPPASAITAAEYWVTEVERRHPEQAEELLREMAGDGERMGGW